MSMLIKVDQAHQSAIFTARDAFFMTMPIPLRISERCRSTSGDGSAARCLTRLI
jgi:hypothetical protein